MINGVDIAEAAAQSAISQSEMVALSSTVQAELGYTFMNEILGEDNAPLIFPSLGLSLSAILQGLLAYEAENAQQKIIYLETEELMKEAYENAGIRD